VASDDRGLTGRIDRRRLLMGLGSLAAAVPLAGCGLLGGSSEESGDDSGGKIEKKKLKMGVLPIIDTAAIHLASHRGYFKKEGLDVELVITTSGAKSIPMVVAGDLDIVHTNWTSVFLAQAQGVAKFQVLNAGVEAREKYFQVMAMPNSSVKTPKDLAGKTLAVNARNNIVELAARSTLRANGVDDNSVTYVEVPFPDMPATLAEGRVDAVCALEPFLTQIELQHGGVPIVDLADGPTENIAIAGVVAKSEFVEKYPNTAAAFRRAMDQAQREVADRKVIEEILPTYTKIDKQVAELMTPPTFPTTINRLRLQRVADLMFEYKQLEAKLDVKALLPAGSQ